MKRCHSWQLAVLMVGAVRAPLAAQIVRSTHVPTSDSVFNIGVKQIVIGAAVLGGILMIDSPIAHVFDNTASPGSRNTARQLDRFGDATGIVTVLGGLGIASLVTRNHVVIRTALHTAASVVIAAGITDATKFLVARSRPVEDPDRDGFDFHEPGNSRAFPSGHATIAFAMATSLGDAVNRNWARVAFFGLATATGWARLREQKHWVSDVVAGAAIGFISAKFAAGRVRLLGIRAPHLLVSPYGAGLAWRLPMPGLR